MLCVHSTQDIVETVVAHDIMGRLMIQCALQPGLSHVLQARRSGKPTAALTVARSARGGVGSAQAIDGVL